MLHGEAMRYRKLITRMVDLLLVSSLALVVSTALIIERFDINGFRPHELAGYGMTVLVVFHIALHRRWGRHRPSRVEIAADTEQLQSEAPPTVEHSGGSRRAVLASLIAGAAGLAAGWRARSEALPNVYEEGDVGLFYHRESSLGVQGLLGGLLDWGSRPPQYKDFAPAGSVPLPPIAALPVMSVAQAIEQRRSRRTFADRAMTAEELAWMVHAATGITSDDGNRTTPSAGALYPIETYVAVSRVDGIEPGLYNVDVRALALQPVRSGSVAGNVMVAGLGQDFLQTASAVFVLSGSFQRTRWKYRARHYRYVCWEAGHIAQNLYLAGEAAGLGVCVVGAFFDDALNDLLGVDGREEAALGLVAVGPR